MTRYDGKVTIWIQKEDRAKWDAIENKPEWLHKALNPKHTKPKTLEDLGIKKENVFSTDFKVTPPEEVL